MNDVLVTLSTAATSTVQELIRINLDSAEGFTTAAKLLDDAALAASFREYAAQREANAEELKATVAYNGDKPADTGTTTGTLHRWWLELRGKIAGNSVHSLLSEAEKGEDSIKHLYEAAIKECAGTPISGLLSTQYAGIKAGHDRVRDLRNATK